MVELIKQCIFAVKDFCFVLGLMYFAFAEAYYFKNYLNAEPDESQMDFMGHIADIVLDSFGSFRTTNVGWLKSNFEWAFFLFSVFFIVFVMMNLFIGILSEELSNALENQDMIKYASCANSAYNLETFLIWKRN
jgi:hypothetical protein